MPDMKHRMTTLMKNLTLALFVLTITGCGIYGQSQEVPVETKAQEITVCELKKNPAKYNHMRIKVTGYFSRDFEDSSLYDPTCDEKQSIWVELAGKKSVNVVYCCGPIAKSTREKELQIEGISLPLTEDDKFTAYNRLLNKKKDVRATVIGTFFSGEKMRINDHVFYGGFGHFGLCSLFVVQQVLSSELAKK
jgi:hypothetical protein